MIDFTALNDHLNARALQILQDIVPGGRLIGSDWTAGSELGGPGDSFKYNIKKMTGSDFASDKTFGDLISLYAAIHNVPMIEAAKTLADQYGFKIIENNSAPDFKHFKHGMPSKTWPYHDANGQVISYVARYDTADGKQFCPFTLIDGRWQMKHLSVPRPLYNLPALSNHNNRPVIIVEGEKSCDACRAIVEERYAVISWPCGAKSVSKADWTPLKGKNVIIWPDADRPGREAADHIYSFIHKHAASVKILRTDDLPDGFDAADFQGGWPELKQFLIDRLPKPPKKPEVLPAPQAQGGEIADETDVDAPIITGSLHEAWIELGIATNKNGNAISNFDNVTRVLEGCLHFRGKIWYDEFLDKIMYRTNGHTQPWSDICDINMAIKLQRHLGLTGVTDTMIFKAVAAYARQNTRNVIVDYLTGLEWDQKPRLSQFFQTICGAEDTDYTQAISSNFIISMVARAMNPGCKVDTMPILEGKQGAKKSTMLEILAGRQFHANISSNLHDKDFYQCMQGKWLLEFAELHQFSKADITKVKDILSSAKDTYRSSYGRTPADHPRRSVFSGTTNEETYLSDNTGARRFWPVPVNFINTDALVRDRDQYFAEAVHLYNARQTWWEVPESAADVQEDRRIRDPWEDDISEFCKFRNEVRVSEILKDCLHFDASKKTRFDEKRVADVLKIIGFQRRKIRFGGLSKWGFVKNLNDLNREDNVNFDE